MLPLDVKATLDMRPLQDVMGDFLARGGEAGNVMPVIAEDLTSAVVERFELQSGFEQGPWDPLKKATLDARRKSKSPQTLEDTGVLIGSITPFDDADTAEAYTNVPYAKYHTSKEPRTVIPLRDFTDVDMGSIQDRAIDLVLGEIATFG
jgi:phage gpG-like protein